MNLSDRELLSDWVKEKGEVSLMLYWEDKSKSSIDNIPTRILEKTSNFLLMRIALKRAL